MLADLGKETKISRITIFWDLGTRFSITEKKNFQVLQKTKTGK